MGMTWGPSPQPGNGTDKKTTHLPSTAFHERDHFFLPDQRMLNFSRNGKASFSRLLLIFFFFISQTKPYLFQQSSSAFPPPRCSLAGAVPWAPSLLALLSLVCAAHPSWALAKSCPSPSPALLHAPAIPPSLFFGPGFPLSYSASSSAPTPGCIHGSSRQLPKRATSHQSHPHAFPGTAKAS